MKIEYQCSNCGKREKVSAMAGIPEGMFALGYRAVGDALYCPDCVNSWAERNGKPFDEQYKDVGHMFAERTVIVMTLEQLEALRSRYPAGTRVELLQMDDAQAPPTGTCGTVIGVDDTGSLLVNWDNGSGLNVLYGIDRVRKVVG